MLQITDPGIPNGLTQNLGGLVQALIERRDKNRQFDLEEKKLDMMGGKSDGSLAEAIRNHDLMAGYRDRIAGATEKRADTGATNADERGRHNKATEGLSGDRNVETGRHNEATETQAGENADNKGEAAIAANARAMTDSWATSQFRPPTPEQIADVYDHMMEKARSHAVKRAAPPAAGAPAPAGAPNPGQAPGAPAPAPMAPGAPVPAPQAAPTTSQIQLKHRASQWISLPSLKDSDKQKVQQAIDSNNFDALARMEAKLSQINPGPSAR
jgi:hypothetical protein